MIYSRLAVVLALAFALGGGWARECAAEEGGPWERFVQRVELEGKRYAEENPDWPAGEPAPLQVLKKAFARMPGREVLETVQDGIRVAKETHADATEEERERQIRLVIDRVMEIFPLVERNPQGHANLLTLIGSRSTDPVFRLFLVESSYASDAPDTLFSLYFREKCRENRAAVLRRFKGHFSTAADDGRFQGELAKAFFAMCRADVLDALESDRTIRRLVEEEGLVVVPTLLRDNPELRVSTDTREKVAQAARELDAFLPEFRVHLEADPPHPEEFRTLLLDILEAALETFDLPSAEEHRDLLAEHGRTPQAG